MMVAIASITVDVRADRDRRLWPDAPPGRALGTADLGMRNTRAVLDLFAKNSTTPIFSFAMGKAIDIVKGKANEQMKGINPQRISDADELLHHR